MHTYPPPAPIAWRQRRASRFGIAVAIASIVLVGCGNDNGASDADSLAEDLIEQAASGAVLSDGSVTIPTESSSSSDASSPSDGSTPAEMEKRDIDKTVWWGGFKITVVSAEGSRNALSATIDVSVSFENLTDEVKGLDRSAIVLTVGTQSFLSGMAQPPQVPAGSRNDAVLDFLVDDTFDFDEAVLTFGQPDTNQAVVPFGVGDATSFEPVQLQVDNTLTTSLETIHLTGGTIDASYAPAEQGTFIVRLPLQATYTGGGAGDLLLPNQFALRSPNGSSVVGLPIAPGDVVAEPVYTGQDLNGLTIAFKVTAMDAGTWTVTYTDSAGETATADFTVD